MYPDFANAFVLECVVVIAVKALYVICTRVISSTRE